MKGIPITSDDEIRLPSVVRSISQIRYRSAKMKEKKNIEEIKFSKWVFASISLLPIILWPLFFYGSIFIFDDPSANKTHQYLTFYGINAYPIYLIVNTIIANKLYNKNNKICIVLYLWPDTLFGLILFYIFSN